MPNIEVPILFLFFEVGIDNHFIMHSLIGALTIGTLLSILTTIFVYPLLAWLIFRVDKSKVKEACKLTPVLVLSCMFGNVFHILLDLLMHPYSFILWPFVDPNNVVGILVLIFALDGNINQGFLIANILSNLIMAVFMFIIVIKNRKNLWEEILIGEMFVK